MRWSVAVVVLVGACRSPARPAPEPEPKPQAAVAVAIDAAPGAPVAPDAGVDCVEVVAFVEGNVFRGTPTSQALWDALDTAEEQDSYNAMSHGQKYLACTFDLRIAGKTYRFEHDGEVVMQSDDLDPEQCKTDAERAEVVRHVEAVTRGCTDLHAGEYWGDFLRAK